ncbi:hypothetical protein C2I18_07015 [Paenibacillus sp. PK3_47]|uniref:copper amine oxidase N-terminal domain-containing protein n=1 Tax=Paenibacillus sp. PK3_47 TaxID=2072642 RepID=UPI00201DE4C7|nr:copper amine oxidase N-terminal domain-containing protein [Paenibacillus sp. PK3_47]UQZ33331.1 hypothetical protein C2I18_07015 [Paenibacillus sp. PK3_47]
MKKLVSFIGAGLLALMLAVPAFAADKPIKVYINGSNISFTAGTPYLENNSVLVPFRVIFEKLGLQVLWDAKTGTVTGTSPDLTISLKIGSNRATVNGTVKKVSTAPVTRAGTTYVPLRFVAEATGGTALWEAASRSVQIHTSVSTAAADEKAIKELIQLSNKYYNEENAAGFYSLIVDDGSNADLTAEMDAGFELYDRKTTIESLKILSLQGNEATVYTSEKEIRTGGYYIPDEQIEYLYTLVRNNGVWQISGMDLENSTVLLTREQGMKAAPVPQNDAAAIKSSVSKYYQAMTEENLDGTLAVMTSYGEDYDDALKADMLDYFDAYDFSYTLDASNIYYFAAGEAAVFTESTVTEAETGESYKQSQILILSQTAGDDWTIDEFYSLYYDN